MSVFGVRDGDGEDVVRSIASHLEETSLIALRCTSKSNRDALARWGPPRRTVSSPRIRRVTSVFFTRHNVAILGRDDDDHSTCLVVFRLSDLTEVAFKCFGGHCGGYVMVGETLHTPLPRYSAFNLELALDETGVQRRVWALAMSMRTALTSNGTYGPGPDAVAYCARRDQIVSTRGEVMGLFSGNLYDDGDVDLSWSETLGFLSEGFCGSSILVISLHPLLRMFSIVLNDVHMSAIQETSGDRFLLLCFDKDNEVEDDNNDAHLRVWYPPSVGKPTGSLERVLRPDGEERFYDSKFLNPNEIIVARDNEHVCIGLTTLSERAFPHNVPMGDPPSAIPETKTNQRGMYAAWSSESRTVGIIDTVGFPVARSGPAE